MLFVPEMKSLVLEMTDLLREECFTPEDAAVLDFRNLDGTNCYCSAEAADVLKNGILKVRDLLQRRLRWIDTGDYHYLTAILIESLPLETPVELLLYDNHPDDQPLAFEEPGMLSCGSWVKRLRDKGLTARGPELPLYVSIDLDALDINEFRTDWNQGTMTLDGLLDDLTTRTLGRRILAVDICGGLTISKGATAEDLSLNLRQRQKLEKELVDRLFTLR